MSFVLRNLLRHRTRSLLTLLGVALAVTAMLALEAVGQGAIRMFHQLMTRQADLILYQKKSADLMLSSVPESLVSSLAQVPGVAYADGVVLAPVSVEGADVFTVLGMRGGSPNQGQLPVVAGAAFGPADRGVLMLGAIGAEVLGKGVGDRLEIYESEYRIVAVYKSEIGFQDAGGVVPLADAQSITEKAGLVSAVHLKLADPLGGPAVKAELARRFPAYRAVSAGEFKDQYLQFKAIRFFADAVTLIAFLLGSLGMANTFLMAVRERAVEFGILRALGWSRSRVVGMVMAEVACLCGLGFLLGAGAAVLGLGLVERVPAWTQYVQGGVPPVLFVEALGVTLVFGLGAGIYPAVAASRVDPLAVLRGRT